MKLLLSFAVGSILGDIFFHLIPESVQVHVTSELDDSHAAALRQVGLSVIAGIFLFVIVERFIEASSSSIFPSSGLKESAKTSETKQVSSTKPVSSKPQNAISGEYISIERGSTQSRKPRNDHLDRNNNGSNNTGKPFLAQIDANNNFTPPPAACKVRESVDTKLAPNLDGPTNNLRHSMTRTKAEKKKIQFPEPSESIEKIAIKIAHIDSAGYLNLIANGFDNFTHGLAIGASFLAGQKVGLLTTFVVLIHEIPHEICDYAILVKSGFTRWDAVRAQSMTSIFGILGTATALSVKSVQTLNSRTLWILPFSAGGFLYIALVNIMTEIIGEEDDSSNKFDVLKQIVCLISGIIFMALVAFL